MLKEIPNCERVISIEDTPELKPALESCDSVDLDGAVEQKLPVVVSVVEKLKTDDSAVPEREGARVKFQEELEGLSFCVARFLDTPNDLHRHMQRQ